MRQFVADAGQVSGFIAQPDLQASIEAVIPAKAGIQLIKKSSREAGRHDGFVRFTGCLFLLDSRFRGNDDNGAGPLMMNLRYSAT